MALAKDGTTIYPKGNLDRTRLSSIEDLVKRKKSCAGFFKISNEIKRVIWTPLYFEMFLSSPVTICDDAMP